MTSAWTLRRTGYIPPGGVFFKQFGSVETTLSYKDKSPPFLRNQAVIPRVVQLPKIPEMLWKRRFLQKYKLMSHLK